VSDDGEPSGSAGKPILNAIDSKEITNVFVVVVRYFGGTLLGVPGLINAYRQTASLALQIVPVIQKPVLILFELQLDYTIKNQVTAVLKQLQVEILKNENQLFCIMLVGVLPSKLAEFEHRIKEFHTLSYTKA
jgi:putative IMPACT (imprinted ancient) family translation regulator